MSQVNVKISPLWMRNAERIRRVNAIQNLLHIRRDLGRIHSQKVFCASFEAPIGVIYVASTETGVCKIALPKDGKASFFNWIGENFSQEEIVDDRGRNSSVIRQLNEYFIGKRTKFELDIDLTGTSFQQKIWTEVAKTPYGAVITYKQIAKRIHSKGFRAVGLAVSRNPLPIVIPCHRVIGSDSKLVGYAGGIKLKEYLLRLEGILLI